MNDDCRSWQADAAEMFGPLTEISFHKRATLWPVIGRAILTTCVSVSIKILPAFRDCSSARYFANGLLVAEKEISEWQKSNEGGKDKRQQSTARSSKG